MANNGSRNVDLRYLTVPTAIAVDKLTKSGQPVSFSDLIGPGPY